MAGEWRETPFQELLSEPVRNGIYKPKDFHGRGTKIVNMGDLFAHPRLRSVPMERIQLSEVEAERFSLAEGDLLFARRSLVAEGAGKCSVVLNVDEPTTFESSIIRARPDTAKVEPLFLYYFFSSTTGLHRLDTIRRQVAVAGITGSDLSRLEIPIPSLAEQRAIAHILGTLDDKIELNQRMSETLEAIARALFRSWFVDFDPVRRNIARRERGQLSRGQPSPAASRHPLPEGEGSHPTKLPSTFGRGVGGEGRVELLDALFPDRLVDSDLGEIPEGWEVATIGEVAEVIDCLHSKKPDRRESGLPLLQLSNIRDDGLIDMEDTYFIDEADYRKWVSRMEASPGDCVITNAGRVGAVAQMPSGQTAALGRNMTGIRCKPAFPFPTVLIECLLSQAMKNEIAQKMDTGTILDALNVRNIPRLRFVRPRARAILNGFERTARPLRSQMERQHAESRTLAALRDALLPKLISGELRVKDAERFLQGAVA